MKKLLLSTVLSAALFSTANANAADYVIDTDGAHAFVTFKIKHLGYSWLHGRFNTFSGDFSYDNKKPDASKINVTIETKSIDSNHAERDKHLRGKDFLNVDKHPTATFKSTSIKFDEEGDEADVTGEFTLNGVTKTITFEILYNKNVTVEGNHLELTNSRYLIPGIYFLMLSNDNGVNEVIKFVVN